MTDTLDNRRAGDRIAWTFPRWLCIAGCLAAAAYGLEMLFAATHSGPGLSPDSLDYLRGARSLMDHRGFGVVGAGGSWKAETHLAPLFPWLLSLIARHKESLYPVARLFNPSLFLINTALAALLVRRAVDTTRRWMGMLAGGIVFALSPILIELHSMVWSEPLYLTLWFVCALAIGRFFERHNRLWLLAAGVAAGLACLDRYSALSLLGAVEIVLLIDPTRVRSFARRIGDAVAFAIPAILPFALLAIRNVLLTGNATDRTASFHPPNKNDWHAGMVAIAGWLLPHSNRTFVVAGAITVAAIIVALTLASWKIAFPATTAAEPRDRGSSGLLRVLLVFIPVYIAFLLCSVFFFDAHTVLDLRILSPLYLPVTLLLTIVVIRNWPGDGRAAGTPKARLIITVLAIALCIAETYRANRFANWAREHGLGYSNTRWQQSELIRYARRLPPGTVVYTNAPDALMLLSDVVARLLPKVEIPGTRGVAASYKDELNSMRGMLKHPHTFIFYFHRVGRSYLASEQKLQDDLHLRRTSKMEDGSVYVLRWTQKRPATNAR